MRVKGGTTTRKRHKKILKQTKGYRGQRSKIYKRAKEAYLHAGQYAYTHRRSKKGQMRMLWIIRINAALSEYKMSYSQFINKLQKHEITLNRKSLSELAINYPEVFNKVVEKVKA
ncbi:MAG: 50S ribosomal protein L20 [Candidatus Dojkabacteria bacterium]